MQAMVTSIVLNQAMFTWQLHHSASNVVYTVKKRRVNLIKLWSPQLNLSDLLHLVIKERAHKCSPYFDHISISELKKELN